MVMRVNLEIRWCNVFLRASYRPLYTEVHSTLTADAVLFMHPLVSPAPTIPALHLTEDLPL